MQSLLETSGLKCINLDHCKFAFIVIIKFVPSLTFILVNVHGSYIHVCN